MPAPGHDPTVISLPTDLRTLWHLFCDKLWVVAVCAAVCGAAGFFYAARLPKVYAATATVQVEPQLQRPFAAEYRAAEDLADEEVLKTMEQNLLSPSLALRLVHHPELAGDPAFLPHIERPASDERLQTALSSQISADIRRGTRLIDVTIEDENPAMAQKLARLLVEEFLRESAEARAAVSQGAHSSLREEAEQLKARLTKSEQALQNYKEQHRAVSLEEKENIVIERLKELSANVTAARADRLKLETDLAQLQTAPARSREALLALPSIAGASEVGELRRKLSEKETEIAALSRRYKSEHPKFIEAASALAELKSALDAAIAKASEMMEASLEAAQTTEGKLEQALRGQEGLALELSKIAIPYRSLERDVVSDRALYESLLSRVKESAIGQSISQHTVRVVTPALLPTRPAKPNKRLIILLSICVGTAVGTTLTLGSSLLDRSLKTVDQAEQALGLRSLAAIPTRAKTTLEDARRLLLEKPPSAVAETVRGLRTALQFVAPGENLRTLVFTSAVPGEGKSFCAISCAVAFAQQGHRTLLIDGDLRLPSIGRVFLGNERTAGLAELLRGTCELGEAAQITSIENLSILTAGIAVEDPAELVDHTRFADLLQFALTRFDRVVIDTAPVLAVSETLVLASLAQAVCLVVRAGKTPAPVAVRALQRLRESGARVPGFILNGLPTRNGGYYYHYHAPGYGRDEVYGGSAAAKR
ncbi:MAG: hypothetical protein JWQ44_2060 [Chthoniobacter sp.]|nr:hypothetical protein [Chthoniobacter sp.]